jgi:hypothetical protein
MLFQTSGSYKDFRDRGLLQKKVLSQTFLVVGIKNTHLVEDFPMSIPGQFGFNCPSGFREEAF